MITKLKLNNFKIFKENEIDFAALTLITGINGVGKSSIIQSLLLLKQSFEIEYLQTQERVDLSNDFINLESAEDLCYAMAANDNKKVSIELTLDHKDIHSWIIDASNPKAKVLNCKYSGNKQYESIPLFSEDFVFLAAERWGPRESYFKKEKRAYNTKLGIQGELAPAYIANAITVNEQIGIAELRHASLGSANGLYENLNAWMSEIVGLPLKAKITELDESRLKLSYNIEGARGKSYSALQVGFGLTYSLPLILSLLRAKNGDLLIFENPEAHLHPSAQSKIGRLLSIAAKHGIQIIVETHSEHILNGVRLSIVKGDIQLNEVSVNFVSNTIENESSNINISKIQIRENGDFEEWPVSFFDQAEQDYIELLKIKAER